MCIMYKKTSLIAQLVKNPSAMRETQVQFLGQEDSPLQYSCLENSMDRRAWWATVHGVAKEQDTTEQLNTHAREKKKKVKVALETVKQKRKAQREGGFKK